MDDVTHVPLPTILHKPVDSTTIQTSHRKKHKLGINRIYVASLYQRQTQPSSLHNSIATCTSRIAMMQGEEGKMQPRSVYFSERSNAVVIISAVSNISSLVNEAAAVAAAEDSEELNVVVVTAGIVANDGPNSPRP